MIITGYHGTSCESADNIIRTKEFKISQGNKEWLGNGIYFYVNYEDATRWTKSRQIENPAVLHCLIEVQDDEFIDFDSDEGKKIVEQLKTALVVAGIKYESPQQNQCALMNLIWNKISKVKVLMGSFATQKSILPTLIDGRNKRKEFCVRSNEEIKSIVKLEVI